MARCTCGLHEPVLRACAGCAVAAVLPVEKGEGTTLVFHTMLLSRLRLLARSSGREHYVMFFRRLFAVTRKSCMVGSPGCSTNAALPANAQTNKQRHIRRISERYRRTEPGAGQRHTHSTSSTASATAPSAICAFARRKNAFALVYSHSSSATPADDTTSWHRVEHGPGRMVS